ncbi:prepilin-type N-terminal cleavage/methylation domain-containing protein [Psychrobacter sp. APC 3281]|uniref:GspH/FimT family pseudopilin n=1 Tax=Psychrobacter sp. APC 3281 TaxID=3035190 RepID=UPI0025B37217|nr:GspH/FimT family pseudopilin [Psychrobacter sp. APC 3281]MDN3447207.1 prepilin-type N-terminal cleavage/methylation domain-containing protein [Psychrobacter sp. APC 3281]
MNASLNTPLPKLKNVSSGFTLIELMVTIAVLAIIMSIAAPNISTQLANQRVKSTAATLANALKEAKAESIIRRQNITLSYDNDSNPKVITISGSEVNPIANYSYNDESEIVSVPETITFEPSKRVTAIVTYTVCDSNTSVQPRVISVSRVANITDQIGGSC